MLLENEFGPVQAYVAPEIVGVVKLIVPFSQTNPLFEATGVEGVATIEIVVDALAAGQEPLAAMLLKTVYVPGVEAETSTIPVALEILKPAEELNVPPLEPTG